MKGRGWNQNNSGVKTRKCKDEIRGKPFFSKDEESTELSLPKQACISQAPSSSVSTFSWDVSKSSFFKFSSDISFDFVFKDFSVMDGWKHFLFGDLKTNGKHDPYGTFSTRPPPEQIKQKVASVLADTVRTSRFEWVNKSCNLSINIWPHTVTKGSPFTQGSDDTIALRAARTEVITVKDFFSFFFFSSSDTKIPELEVE